MNRILVLAAIAVALALSGCQSMNGDDDHDHDRDHDEQDVTMEQLPAAARATLTREAANGKIDEIDKHTHDGRIEYEADVIIDGKKWEIAVREDGQLLKKQLDEEDDDEDQKDDD